MILNDYEKEMQEQADYIERWKLRKEIKKKLRALRKKVKADEASLPQLQAISRRLDDVEKPLQECVQEKPQENYGLIFMKETPTIQCVPYHVEHYKRTFVYDPRMVVASSTDRIEDVILKQMSEEFGYELLKANAIQYRIYNSAVIDKKQVEMKVDVVVEDK